MDHRFIAIFVSKIILLSSSVINPFSYSAFYWVTSFAQELEDLGPPATPPAGDLSLIPDFNDGTAIDSSSTTSTLEELF